MTSSAVSSISFDDGVKGLKRKTVIVIKDDDSNWAKKIVLTFTANWDVCFEYIRVKKWGNLSIAQMAAALDSAEIVVDGVQYKEEVK